MSISIRGRELSAGKEDQFSWGSGRGHQGRGGRGAGQGRGYGGRTYQARGGSSDKNTTYYSPAELEKRSYEERDRIRKERDKKGEPGGTNKRHISELATKQLTTAITSSIQKAAAEESKEKDDDPPKKTSQAGNAFGGKESTKRTKTCE